MPPLVVEIHACRACGSEQLPVVLGFGDFALSDFLESPDAHVDRAPLVLVRCESCTLVQLRHTVDRERLYRNYWYRSGTQPAMVKALQDIVRDAQSRVPLERGDVVLDIGANDGTLLSFYPEEVIRLAYEPALNLWASLAASGATVVGSFFPPQRPTVYRQAKIITSVACFYDVDDPNAFVAGVKARLADDGIWVNQMAYLPDTLKTNNFGDICHEHLTYWTVQSFEALLGDHGLYLNDYLFNDTNGGSIRTVVSRAPVVKRRKDAPSVADFWKFHADIHEQTSDLENALLGRSVVGYGASTKANTYLQFWGIGPDRLQYIADRNPAKWGKYTPTGQKVISEAEMRAMKPAYLLVLPWHFLDAFMDRERGLLESGTKFIVPFPKLRIVGGANASLQPVGASD